MNVNGDQLENFSMNIVIPTGGHYKKHDK